MRSVKLENLWKYLESFPVFCLMMIALVLGSCSKDEGINSDEDINSEEDNNSEEGMQNDSLSSIIEAVDLGLSVLWANKNIGASSPEDVGNYFYWGYSKVMTYEEFKNDSTDLESKYKKLGNLLPEDDPAYVNIGSEWKTPTIEEAKELINNCTWTYTKRNNVNGFEVKGMNGNSIFLPLSGYRSFKSCEVGTCGYLLVSTRQAISEIDGSVLVYGSDLVYDSSVICISYNWAVANPVRAVKSKY